MIQGHQPCHVLTEQAFGRRACVAAPDRESFMSSGITDLFLEYVIVAPCGKQYLENGRWDASVQ